jgi:hypothetical protein
LVTKPYKILWQKIHHKNKTGNQDVK